MLKCAGLYRIASRPRANETEWNESREQERGCEQRARSEGTKRSAVRTMSEVKAALECAEKDGAERTRAGVSFCLCARGC